MLDEIVVSNLGLIGNASISPGLGLTVITGETGAGKTVMLGALRLLTGEQAPKGLIGPHGDRLDVSARFTDKGERTARRVVTASSSKAYLDGAISTAGALRTEIGASIAIVGQHDQHRVTSSAGVRHLLDSAMTKKENQHLAEYTSSWNVLEGVRKEAQSLGSDHRVLTRELETLRFQTAEIADAGFDVGDDVALQSRVDRLRNSGALVETIDRTLELLGDDGAALHLSEASRALDKAVALDQSLEELAAQVSELSSALSEASAEVVRYASDLETDPHALQETEQRVALLSSLKRKYGDSIETIIAFAKDATARELELSQLLDSAEGISVRLAEAEASVSTSGGSLRAARQNAADRIAKGALEHLKELGFSSPLVHIAVAEADATSTGADSVTVLFASDETLSPGPVSSIASGGELSRLVLALTLASGVADTGIVAFDEIDAGIGGETALAMGQKLSSLATDRQVICVTHLPQVAAFADTHYVVTRTGSTAEIHETVGDDRTEELSRMLAGLATSQKGKEHAEELLELASESKTR